MQPVPPHDAAFVLAVAQGAIRLPLAGELVRIGSDPDATLRLLDPSVAAHHCLVRRSPEGFEIFDLRSPCGVFVNERRVECALLRDGDVVRVGNIRLAFHAGGSGPPPAPPPLLPPAATDTLVDRLVRGLRRSPSWAASVALHVLLLGLLWNVRFIEAEAARLYRIIASITGDDISEEAPDDVALPRRDTPEPLPEPRILEAPPGASATPGDLPPPGAPPAGSAGPPAEALPPDPGALPGSGFDADALALGSAARSDLGARARSLRARGLDVVFAVDSTGSMGSLLEQARQRIEWMVSVLSALVPGWRLGLVTYRDRGDAYVTRASPLTSHVFRSIGFLDGIEAEGGGDAPEAVLEALAAARNLGFAPGAAKVLVLIGDAPPHEKTQKAAEGLCRRFADAGGVVHTVRVLTGSRAGADSATEAFRGLAAAGGGRAVTLSAAREALKRILLLALGDEHAGDLDRAIDDLESGWKVEALRRRIERQDLEFLRERWRTSPLDPLFVREVGGVRAPFIIPLHIETMESRDVPVGSRWAAAVLLGRVLRDLRSALDIDRDILEGVQVWSPDAPPERARRAMVALRKRFGADHSPR